MSDDRANDLPSLSIRESTVPRERYSSQAPASKSDNASRVLLPAI